MWYDDFCKGHGFFLCTILHYSRSHTCLCHLLHQQVQQHQTPFGKASDLQTKGSIDGDLTISSSSASSSTCMWNYNNLSAQSFISLPEQKPRSITAFPHMFNTLALSCSDFSGVRCNFRRKGEEINCDY